MRKIYFLIVLIVISLQSVYAQSLKLSESSEISIITVGPGEALFEAFGHSAIRVKDPILRIDFVYNYGLFDFNQPNFYLNFTKGILWYRLGRGSYQNFVYSYHLQERWLKTQILNLTLDEKQQFFELLETNALPENADYSYDPFFNNCSTKLRDITMQVLMDKVQFPSSLSEENFTLRQLMNQKIHWNTWGSFGINLALGSKLDQKITAEQYMYLPDYVYVAFENATKKENNLVVPLVIKSTNILNHNEKEWQFNWFSPLIIFSVLFLITFTITYKDQKRKKRSKWLDFILYFFTGILGVLILFLWFFTDHSTTPNNFNFLWAFAPNIFIAFMLLKRKLNTWVIRYCKLIILLLFIYSVIWIFGIQLMSLCMLPILGILLLRNYFLIKR
ncbi:MAG: Uncharacterised protein [Flavobacterium sp. SCGC AAA160-P02]|nr:MAG: Uncharacterised protein [Flavobacterium sp. SCGC AAA160-P02]